MAFTSITKPSVGDATKKTAFADAVIDNLNDLNSRVGSGSSSGVPNGSFEAGDPDPDSWTTTDTGGTHTIENDTNSEQAHGADALNFAYNADANGGGYTETTDFAECAAGEYLKIAWKMMSNSATGAKHIVSFYWYKFDQSASGTTKTDAYSDTGNPTAWTQFYTEAVAPTDAKYYKIRITISDTSVTPSAGNTSIDDVRMVTGPGDVFNTFSEYSIEGTHYYYNVTEACLWVEAVGGGGDGSALSNAWGAGGGEYAAGYFIAAAATGYGLTVGSAANSTFNTNTVVAVKGTDSTGTTSAAAGGTGGEGAITINGQTTVTVHGGKAGRGGGGGYGGPSGAAPSTPGGGGGGDQANTTGAVGMVRIWFN